MVSTWGYELSRKAPNCTEALPAGGPARDALPKPPRSQAASNGRRRCATRLRIHSGRRSVCCRRAYGGSAFGQAVARAGESPV